MRKIWWAVVNSVFSVWVNTINIWWGRECERRRSKKNLGFLRFVKRDVLSCGAEELLGHKRNRKNICIHKKRGLSWENQTVELKDHPNIWEAMANLMSHPVRANLYLQTHYHRCVLCTGFIFKACKYTTLSLWLNHCIISSPTGLWIFKLLSTAAAQIRKLSCTEEFIFKLMQCFIAHVPK